MKPRYAGTVASAVLLTASLALTGCATNNAADGPTEDPIGGGCIGPVVGSAEYQTGALAPKYAHTWELELAEGGAATYTLTTADESESWSENFEIAEGALVLWCGSLRDAETLGDAPPGGGTLTVDFSSDDGGVQFETHAIDDEPPLSTVREAIPDETWDKVHEQYAQWQESQPD